MDKSPSWRNSEKRGTRVIKYKTSKDVIAAFLDSDRHNLYSRTKSGDLVDMMNCLEIDTSKNWAYGKKQLFEMVRLKVMELSGLDYLDMVKEEAVLNEADQLAIQLSRVSKRLGMYLSDQRLKVKDSHGIERQYSITTGKDGYYELSPVHIDQEGN